MKTIMRKKRVILPFMLSLLIVMTFAMPLTAFAAPADYDVTVEHRYLKGESVDIPKTLTRYGNDYVLKTKSAPVLESTLPAARTYTYKVDDQISPEDYSNLAASGANITPVNVTLVREAEKALKDIVVPTNDIERLKNDGSLTSQVGADFVLVNATFSDTHKNERGVPDGYTATLTYRGSESYEKLAYYEVKETFSTSDTTGGEQYIVKAVYGLVTPPDESDEDAASANANTVSAPAAPTGGTGGNGGNGGNGADAANTGGAAGDDADAGGTTDIPDSDTPLDNGGGTAQIPDPTVPTDSGTAGMNTATLMMIIAAAVIIIAGIILLVVFSRKRNAADAEL
jgi:hypothetical protein